MRFFNPHFDGRRVRRSFCLWTVVIAGIWQPTPAFGEIHASLPEAVSAQISRLIRQEMQLRHIPGIAVAVVRNGTVALVETDGLADIENGVPVTEETVFGFASVSKPITAVATLQLVESGELSLEARLKEFDLEVPQHLESITVRRLLSHQSGLRHFQTHAHREPLRHFTTLTEAFQARATHALLFEPGTRFGYSTFGYLALGCVVEEAGEAPFVEQLRSRVFRPAGMNHARADHLYEIIPHRARGYFYSRNGEWRNSEPFDASDKIPGGGLCGTILDLAAFAAALQNGQLLSQESIDLMWTPQKLNDGTLTGYGLGWHVAVPKLDEVYHSGSQPRTSSYLYVRPMDQVAVAILCNLEQVDFQKLCRAIAALVGSDHSSGRTRSASPED